MVPFWNGHQHIERLLAGLPEGLPVVVVDDQSDEPLQQPERAGTRVVRLPRRGYFAGAVNAGMDACAGDALVLNQDAALSGDVWLSLLAEKRKRYALIGEGVLRHLAWRKGYVHGTFMFIRRDAWDEVGPLNRTDYPLWGCTCEWQLRACRKGYEALPLAQVPGLEHGEGTRRTVKWKTPDGRKFRAVFGEAVAEAMKREPQKMGLFSRTPPLITVVVPCYNYGHYLKDAVNSLIGGPTSLGEMPGQTFQSFEVIIVDDASTDGSWETAQALADPWKGIHAIRHPQNQGTPVTINTGVEAAHGRYIHVLSADDMDEPWCLETLLRACQKNPHGVAYGDLRIFANGERGKVLKMYDYDFERLLHKNMLPAPIMYRKSAWREVGGYPVAMRDGREDWAFGVALGIHGWCGVHVGDAGWLIRREGQNRSLRTAQAGMVPQFKRQIMALYPNIYAGERPMRCCGGGRASAARNANNPHPKNNPTPRDERLGAQGMIQLEYIGGNTGDTKWHGPVTYAIYVFGDNDKHRVSYVDVRDVEKMLMLRENKRLLFRRYVPPAQTQPAPLTWTPSAQESKIIGTESDDKWTHWLTEIQGVGPATAGKLERAGFRTVRDLAGADPEEVAALAGVSQGQARRFVEGARGLVA